MNTARAEAEKAYELQAASVQQRIQEQMTQVEIVERKKQIEIQEQEIARKEKSLEATIKKPADAEKYRLEKIAEAERKQAILKAEGDAEAKIMKGKEYWHESMHKKYSHMKKESYQKMKENTIFNAFNDRISRFLLLLQLRQRRMQSS